MVMSSFFPLSDLVVGAALYFPPLFKAIALGLFGWLLLHRLLRAHIYGGAIWHPTLCDLALLVICIVLAFALLLIGG
ncbi:DUF1656 domain-containing protein [Edwardsiella tarda]|uniref:DUF1656 domain-containing protein n=1 Tax=Edwardsiella tarda TaxID=636 RepID=UPI00030795BC|nr:DUF1656 domain-containing protein [Edwardsiella tarda]WKS80426.1 DUF1656 domain-containing protein [Edwardsiella tarda]